MLSIYDQASASAALARPLNPILRTLIVDRLHDAEIIGLEKLTHVIVVEPGDNERDILEEIGWSPVVNPIDGSRFGSTDFIPFWSWLQDLGGWYEMILTVGNDGFAFILLIEDADSALPDLLQLCREHGDENGRCG
jgi:hypothetical protein